MLTLLIPGPSSPGNDIDIYLQPLIKDLKELWEVGLETYDASTDKRFMMHAALLSTISDFPAYAMLSGWSTKGKRACPCCHYDMESQWLDHSRKFCYWHHRIFLDSTHPWRHDKRTFGEIEERTEPFRLKDITKKTKDNVCARRDLKVLKILPELQPIEIDDLREEIPRSRFWMTLEKKRLFCRTIKNAKLPQGYASNIARCVQVNEGKITGYKSHDAHFYMHYLLPIVIKATLPKEVATPLIRLFHLVEEIRLGGPICNRCMYAIERFLHELKDDVRNKACPEGSMAEAYWAKECLRFCARYINRPKTSSTSGKSKTAQPFLPNIGRPTRGKGNPTKKNQYGFMIDHITWDQAHQYLLFNCDCKEVKRYISEHMATLSSHRKRKWDTVQNHSKEFMAWFKEKVACMIQQGAVVPEHLKWLSKGPSYVAKRYTRYSVNGFHFHTMKRDANSISQNRGVTLNALTPSFSSSKDQNPIMGSVAYYGSIEDIIELSYHGQFSVVLFRCMWFYSEMNDEFILVNKNRTIGGGEPFILASQARQVFYVEDLTKNGWFYVVHNLPTELSDGRMLCLVFFF
ncbi:uncharacterized protein LOC110713739 [Chenopodium quinoa]|uniref:uncharacterized protein LOC110713739 n=1 Tax=Chenopodium quinoa TaxID=63459 RepID=UPI000B76F196|nr:uncharacterized protein LOC110713739 [Chenopodium quinoa]